VEADLQRFYGLHLCELGTRRLSWRRVAQLVGHLPPESATARSVRGGDGTTTNELLALAVHSLQAANWQRGGGKGPKPKRIRLNGEPEPDTEKIGSKALTIEQMRARLDSWGEGRSDQEEVVI
jgi:hypothetical protein